MLLLVLLLVMTLIERPVACLKPGPHQQQSQSNIVAYTGNFVACYRVECYKVACISNIVASTLLPCCRFVAFDLSNQIRAY